MRSTRKRTAVLRLSMALCLVMALGAAPPAQAHHRRDPVRYVITELGSLGGTSGVGNSINDRGWIVGFSNLAGDAVTHATLWRNGSTVDLGTLGGPNSAVVWPVKNIRGTLVGVAETADLDPRRENWSCSAFFPSVTGHVCRGFVWQDGQMTALPTHGGTHGFATGANNFGSVVGWAETAHEDPTCNDPQELGFLAALWDTRADRVHRLRPLPGDSASAATAINDWGQVVGISGSCANAVGGFSARHAVLWEHGKPIDIGNFGGEAWNTPMAINNFGTVVGFANSAEAVGDTFDYRGFIWTRRGGFRPLGALEGDTRSQGLGLNDWGQVVGLSRGPSGLRAFVWNNGVMSDLNALTDYDGTLILAGDINNAGEITGQAINAAGEAVAFKATPVGTGR